MRNHPHTTRDTPRGKLHGRPGRRLARAVCNGSRDIRPTIVRMLGSTAVEPVMRVLRASDNPRRTLAVLLAICGEYNLDRDHACSRWLHHGRTYYVRERDGEFTRHYLPARHQGGLARELGCCGRSIGRSVRELVDGGLLVSRRRPHHVHDASQIGRTGRPYRTYNLPTVWRGLQEYLLRWWRKGRKPRSEKYRDLSEEADRRAPVHSPASTRDAPTTAEGLALRAAFLAMLQPVSVP